MDQLESPGNINPIILESKLQRKGFYFYIGRSFLSKNYIIFLIIMLISLCFISGSKVLASPMWHHTFSLTRSLRVWRWVELTTTFWISIFYDNFAVLLSALLKITSIAGCLKTWRNFWIPRNFLSWKFFLKRNNYFKNERNW